jgi:hypothetical protein
VKFNKEIVKYHILRNKNYIITQTYDNIVSVYNIFKLKKIKDILNIPFEKAIEILDSLDSSTQKSWFSADIKLGTISLILQKDSLHNVNANNYETNFLEKVFEKYESISQIKVGTSKPSVDTPMNKQKFDKMSSCGTAFVQNIFANYLFNTFSRNYEFVENNFYDNRGYLKKKYLSSSSNKPEPFYYFIYGAIENSFTVSYINELGNVFILPSFIKDVINLQSEITFSVPRKGEKIEIIIDNTKKEFVNKTNTSHNYNNIDELEAGAHVTVGKFKDWLLKAYIEGDSFRQLVESDLNQLVSSNTIKEKDKNYIIEKYLAVQPLLFVDFWVKEQIVSLQLT